MIGRVKKFFLKTTGLVSDHFKLEALFHEKKWLECIERCNQYLEQGRGDHFFIYYYRGMSYRGLKLVDEALLDFEKALAIDGVKGIKAFQRYRDYLWYAIAVHYLRVDDKPTALARLQDGIDEHPHFATFYLVKSEVQLDQGLIGEAIKSIDEGLAYLPLNQDLMTRKIEYTSLRDEEVD